ncbi:MAG: tetratricopeptide repeat protein [Microscillaceae bacterium]|nr:tetratricopeptide repeat protein [Microscillaceae bacterium]
MGTGFVFSQNQTKKSDSLLIALQNNPREDTLRVKILNQLCWQNRNNDFVKAIDYGKQAIALAQKIKDYRGWAESLNFMGIVYRNLGDYGESNQLFFEALRIAEKHRIDLQTAYANNNIGDALKLQKKYTEGLPYAQQALLLFEALQDERGIAYAYVRLGEIYQSLKDYDQALTAFQQSKKIRERLQEKSNLITSNTRIGVVHKLRQELDQALAYFQEALAISLELKDARAVAGCYDFMAGVYILKKDFATAQKYALQSLEIAQKIKARVDERNAYRTLAELYEQEGKYNLALRFQKKFLTLNDSIESVENSTQLAKMQAIYETKKKQQENTLLKKENELRARDADRKNLILLFISLLFVLTLGAIYLVYQSRQKQIKLNTAIESQNREISRKKLKLERNIHILMAISKEGSMSEGDWQKVGQKVTESIELALDADVAQLWYYNYQEEAFYCIGNQGQTFDNQLITKISAQDCPIFLDLLHNEDSLTIENMYAHTELDEVSRTYFLDRHLESAILYPSILSEKQKGILLCADTHPRVWELEDLSFMKSMEDEINLAYQAFRRKQAQEKIEKQSAEIHKKNQSLKTTLKLIKDEQKRTDELLLNILPMETAEELKSTGTSTPKYYALATVLFTDFKGFTQITENLEPQQVIEELNTCFLAFDEICERHNLEKIKTIGDSYMCAGGLPVANQTNPLDCVQAGLEMQAWMEQWKQAKTAQNQPVWEIRIGIHSGPVVAGVVGKNKFAYDIWGDTVNLASRMESAGEVGKVNISEATYELVKQQFDCVYRGKIEAKNKGEVDMYFVKGILD